MGDQARYDLINRVIGKLVEHSRNRLKYIEHVGILILDGDTIIRPGGQIHKYHLDFEDVKLGMDKIELIVNKKEKLTFRAYDTIGSIGLTYNIRPIKTPGFIGEFEIHETPGAEYIVYNKDNKIIYNRRFVEIARFGVKYTYITFIENLFRATINKTLNASSSCGEATYKALFGESPPNGFIYIINKSLSFCSHSDNVYLSNDFIIIEDIKYALTGEGLNSGHDIINLIGLSMFTVDEKYCKTLINADKVDRESWDGHRLIYRCWGTYIGQINGELVELFERSVSSGIRTKPAIRAIEDN